MNIARTFILRPVATTLLMSAIAIFGVMAYRSLPVSDLPNVDFPTLLVSASLPGASPETMASTVATPLERQFSTIAGLASMTSSNARGTSQVTLQFDLSRDIDGAAQDVQAAITQAAPLLPPDMPSPPTYRKVNPADQPILFMAVTSPTLALWRLDEYAETIMAQRISMVSGVAQVQVYGAQKYAVRVRLDPKELASRGLAIDDVEQAIQAANVNLPGGTLYGQYLAYTLDPRGQITEAEHYRPIVVAYRRGAPVRLEDLGEVVDGVEDEKAASWYLDAQGQQRSVVLAVQRQPGTNTLEVSQAVENLLPQLREWLPPSVEIHVFFRRAVSILDSVNDVKLSMALAIALVVLVIFIFVRNLSATVIPSLALPFSIVGTFAVMYPLGYTIDNLSLMALVLSIGFVVDDAIVMLENNVRHLEMGKTPLQAALDGSSEIGFTIVSMTLSLAAVFIPVLFLPGILGRLFREFAVTICVAILISGFVSLTLTPLLCSKFLRPAREQGHGRLYRMTERIFEFLLRVYDRSLVVVVRHRFITLCASLAILAATFYLFMEIPKGFIPDEDQGSVFAVTEASQGISFEDLVAHQIELSEIALKDPNVDTAFSGIGASRSSSPPNQGRIFMHLKDRSERKKIPEVIRSLGEKFKKVAGIRTFLQQPPSIRIGGTLSKSQYQFTLQSPETDSLYASSQALETKLKQIPELEAVTSDLQIASPQVDIEIDRDRASRLGVSVRTIENALFSAYGDRWVSTIYAPNNQYKVIMNVGRAYQLEPDDLALLYVRSSRGDLVPLDTLVRFRRDVGPLTVNHAGQLPAVTLSFNLAQGVSLSQAVIAIKAASREVLPASVSASFQGTAQAFESSIGGLWALLVISIAVIYIVLGILYESFVHPLTILSGLPSAGFGALLTLRMFGCELNVYGFVGLILLIGIVKKNAIMQIDFALQSQREHGKNPMDAIHEACLIRFRPILMTTLAALLGALPFAIGFGAGGDARQPLGLAVVGGLVFSQLVTLYLTPVYYYYFEHTVEMFRAWRHRRAALAPAAHI